MTVLRDDFTLFRAGYRRDFRDEWTQFPEEWSQYANKGSIDGPEVMASILTSINRLFEVGDNVSPVFERPKQSRPVSAVDKEYAVGVSISRKAREDDKYNKLTQVGKHMAHAARMTYEYRVAAVLDDAFTGNVYKGIDGLALCHTSHTFLNNGANTWANTISNPVGLSVAGLTALLDLAMVLKDHNGDPIVCNPDRLIIGNNATDALIAEQIFNTEKEPFTANNEINAMRRKISISKRPITSHYKTSRASYFLFDSRMNDLHCLIRRPVNSREWEDPKTKAFLAAIDTRFLIWFVDPRGWFGANAT